MTISALTSVPVRSAAEPAARDVRHNVVALGADFSLYLVAMGFASQSTILPAFAAELGAPSIVIGAIPAVMTLGWLLPSLFAAGHTESLSRKLPFVLRYTVFERLPFVVLALVAFFLARPSPSLSLGLLLVMLLVVTGSGGVLMPAWMDIVGRAIPTGARGRFFAVSNVLGSAGGLAGSVATAYFLARVPSPASYGVCFLCAALFMGLSYLALVAVREPPAAAAPPRVPMRDYLRRVPGLLRRDPNFVWFLCARACWSVGTMAGAFYTVYALRAWDAPAWWVGTFTGALLGGQIVGNAIFGPLADHAGHRPVIIAGVAAGVAANLVALSVPTLGAFAGVFALTGIQLAAINVSGLNVLLEFARSADERPTYVGLGTTLIAPVVCAAPLCAGLMVEAAGFVPMFAASAAGGLAALLLLIGRVRDPRHAAVAPSW
jgi:MFS family permease